MCVAVSKAALLNSRRYLRPLTRVGGRYAGETPLDWATVDNNGEVVALLRAAERETEMKNVLQQKDRAEAEHLKVRLLFSLRVFLFYL